MQSKILICRRCGKKFQKELKEITRRKRLGKECLFCSLNCSRKQNGLERRGKRTRDTLSPFRTILKESKHGAKLRGYSYSLQLKDLITLWEKQDGLCPYTHKRMVLSGRDRKIPESASLDRIDSTKGYQLDNVEFVCVFVNFGKNRFSQEQIRQFFKC